MRTRDSRLRTAACSVPFEFGGHYRLAVQQPRTPFGQPRTAGVASHIIRVRGPHHSLQLHHALQRGEMSRPFYADLLSGGLEDATRAKRPIPQSIGPTEPTSKKINFRKNNKFPSFISSSFIFAILSLVSVNFPPIEHSNF
jgi:hypothetical protein